MERPYVNNGPFGAAGEISLRGRASAVQRWCVTTDGPIVARAAAGPAKYKP